MIPGPYSICHVTFIEQSDAPILKTLRYGYDSAEAAYRDLNKIAIQANISADECTVIRYIDSEEALQFTI
jgi:hypothetical protein